MASDDDEIARLLREVEAVTGSGSAPKDDQPPPAEAKPSGEVVAAEKEAGAGSRSRWVAISAAGAGAVGFFAGTFLAFLPAVDGISTGLGAAGGAALAALVGGPPRWLR